jgi:hypothetical protein
MSRTAVLGCLILAVGCAPGQDQEAPEADMPETAAPAATDLSAFAGTWSMQALTEAGDSVLVAYEMVATDGTEGWTITFPDRDPIPAHIVEALGDSVIIHVGPYPSALRDDVMVSTVTVSRIVDGRMTGYFTATYDTEGADQILKGLQQGERMN